jgi:cobalt/nickel transport system permease protein
VTGRLAGSVETVSGVLRSFFVAERVAARDGFLQSRDPRAVVVSVVALATAAVTTRSLAVIAALAALTAVLGWRSSVPPRRLLARSAVVPLVSASVVLPQAVLLPGDPVATAFGLTVTGAGVTYVTVFTLRVAVGVALLSLLVLTTPFPAVVAALRDLRVPVAVVWVLSVTYRYLFLFFDELRRLIVARNGRTTGTGSVREGWRDARRLAGTFLLRVLDRSERVGRGMRARGGGSAPTPYGRRRSTDAGDRALLVVSLAAVVVSGVVRWLP